MGDRGNICVKQEHGEVWFYTHWSGHRTADIVRDALARNARWNDEPYLARIIFCQLIGKDTGGETGFGISTEIGDSNYPTITVDCPRQEVTRQGKTLPFNAFSRLTDEALEKWCDDE